LWRVRNALGNKNIIAFDGQSYSIQERAVIFYDVHEFEGLLAQSRRRGLTEVERKAIFTQAIDLYCGDFLPDMDLPWIDMRRAELREKYLSLLEQSAADEFENRHFEEARWLYEKAIEIDPYQDLLHLGVMKCLVQLRRPASAKVHFEKYRQNLLAELGSEPMPELRELVEGI
jgi:two-component SAPR family response regulator